ncbi:unnamed protein product [Chrysoparadoxa australica]
MAKKLVGKINPGNTFVFVCDVQERFRSLIHNMPDVIETARYMVGMSKALDIPVVATEQYPKAFLHTVPEVELGSDVPVFEKKLFSMWTDELQRYTQSKGLCAERGHVVLCGIEAHVCVTQTCLDLIESGLTVHVVVDGCSSQRPLDRAVGLSRMQQAGAYLTSAESVTFQLLGSAEHPKFKEVSKLVKDHNAIGNTFSQMSSVL